MYGDVVGGGGGGGGDGGIGGGGVGGGGGGGSNSGDGHLNSTAYVMNNSYAEIPKRDPLYIVVPMTVMYSVIFVTGVIGNSITCMVIVKHKYMHTATNYYLFSLAVSDLILLVSGLPQEMWSIWSRYPYVFGEIFCQLRGLFAEMSANATVLTITAFTAERYVAICHPFMAQSMSKLSRAVKLIVGIWLVAVLFAVPQAVQFTVSPMNDTADMMQCNIRSIQLMDVELSTVSFTVSTVLFFVLPMTFITVLYALIGLRLRRTDRLKRTITVRSSNGEKKNSSLEYRANSSSKVLKMLVAVVVAFFICWAPFHAQRLIAIFGSSQTEDVTFLQQLYGISTYVSGVLYYLSTTVNPILYHIMSLKFRTAFKETVLRCCRSSKRTDSSYGGAVSDGIGVQEQREPWRWRLRRRNRHRRRRRPSDSSVAATADVRRQKYRRVSGRATSSFELSADDGRLTVADDYAVAVVDRARSSSSASSTSVGLADCWRRVLNVGGARKTARHRVRDDYDDDDGSSGSPPVRLCGGAQRSAGPVAISNWTMISDSSLKDVDCDDLREELFASEYVENGSAVINVPAATCTLACGRDDNVTVRIVVGDDCYY